MTVSEMLLIVVLPSFRNDFTSLSADSSVSDCTRYSSEVFFSLPVVSSKVTKETLALKNLSAS